jgi:hypothetical protein
MRHTALVIVIVSLIIIAEVYRSLNESGWIPYRRDTVVWMSGDWMAGEYRDCNAEPNTQGSVYMLSCVRDTDPSVTYHMFPVTYWGKKVRPDIYAKYKKVVMTGHPERWKWDWNCQRKQESFTCKALN